MPDTSHLPGIVPDVAPWPVTPTGATGLLVDAEPRTVGPVVLDVPAGWTVTTSDDGTSVALFATGSGTPDLRLTVASPTPGVADPVGMASLDLYAQLMAAGAAASATRRPAGWDGWPGAVAIVGTRPGTANGFAVVVAQVPGRPLLLVAVVEAAHASVDEAPGLGVLGTVRPAPTV